MRSTRFAALVFALFAMVLAPGAFAQSLEDLNIQIHGYATQGFLYTTQNNILTTNSSDGSAGWSEAVVNVGAQPIPKLRIGVQARYYLLGNYGNAITLDWAAADYRINDKIGVRFGKVKTPSGLFNETQDIDPSYMWSLLPQSVYPISSRNSLLAHSGGVVYGKLPLGGKMGKLEYRGWGGERVIAGSDGYLLNQVEQGLNLPNGINGATYGEALHWLTPITGLMLGASNITDTKWSAALTDTIPGFGTFNGTDTVKSLNEPSYFAKYEKNKVMVAGEFSRLPVGVTIIVPNVYTIPFRVDQREWYVMASYKVTNKLTAGVYDSNYFDHQKPLGPARYQKDWAISGRYDFNEYIYAKAEEHILQGTAQGYDATLNPGGLKPNSKLTILKVGVSF